MLTSLMQQSLTAALLIAAIFGAVIMILLRAGIVRSPVTRPLEVVFDSLRHERSILSSEEQDQRLATLGVSLAPRQIIVGRARTKEWIAVYTPRWRGKYFMGDAALRQALETRFIENLMRLDGPLAILSVSLPAARFISNIKRDLDALDIGRGDFASGGLSRNEPASIRKAILFDMVMNTSRTMFDAAEYYEEELGEPPFAICTILYNDFLPAPYRDDTEQWAAKTFGQQSPANPSFYITTVNNLIPHFPPDISETLRKIQALLRKADVVTVESKDYAEELRNRWVDGNLPPEP